MNSDCRGEFLSGFREREGIRTFEVFVKVSIADAK